MAEQRVVRREDDVRVGRLVEVPAVAVAPDLEDADLLEALQAAHAGVGVGVELQVVGAVAVGVPRRVLDVGVLGDPQQVPHALVVVAVRHDLHELGQVGAAAEVRAVGPDHEHLDVVVEAGEPDQVRVPVLGIDGHRVQVVGAVERDRGDLGLRVLLVEDDLLGGRSFLALFHALSSVGSRLHVLGGRLDEVPELEELHLAGRGPRDLLVGDEHEPSGDLEAREAARRASRRLSSSGDAPAAGTMAAATSSPRSSSGRPVTSASSTSGRAWSAASTSRRDTFAELVLIMSPVRPTK